jgi:hypothetical protein
VQVSRPSYLAIHFAEVFPATSVLCMSKAASTPATSDWRYVTCRRCLVAGLVEGSSEAGAELARRDAERDAQERGDNDGTDATRFDLGRAARFDEPSFAAHLAAMDEERLRMGRESRGPTETRILK